MNEIFYTVVLPVIFGAVPGAVLYLFISWNDSNLAQLNKGLSTAEIFRKAANKWNMQI